MRIEKSWLVTGEWHAPSRGAFVLETPSRLLPPADIDAMALLIASQVSGPRIGEGRQVVHEAWSCLGAERKPVAFTARRKEPGEKLPHSIAFGTKEGGKCVSVDRGPDIHHPHIIEIERALSHSAKGSLLEDLGTVAIVLHLGCLTAGFDPRAAANVTPVLETLFRKQLSDIHAEAFLYEAENVRLKFFSLGIATVTAKSEHSVAGPNLGLASQIVDQELLEAATGLALVLKDEPPLLDGFLAAFGSPESLSDLGMAAATGHERLETLGTLEALQPHFDRMRERRALVKPLRWKKFAAKVLAAHGIV